MATKDEKKSSSNSGYFASLSKKKKGKKILLAILAFVLSVGLVGSSMFWAFGDSDIVPQTASEQQINTAEQQIADLEAQIKEEPTNTALIGLLAKLYKDNGDGAKAVENYEKALKIKQNDLDMKKELGVTYFLLGDYHNAALQMQQVIELKPDDAYAHYYVGQFNAFRNDEGRNVAKGIAELEEFIRIQKEGPDVEKAKQYIEELRAGQNK